VLRSALRTPIDDDEDLLSLVQIAPSARAKRIALRVDSKERQVRLVVPKNVSQRKALAFARQHRSWIEKQLASLPGHVPLQHGQSIPVFGQLRTIQVQMEPALKRTLIKLQDKELLVRTNQEDPSLRIARFLKAEAKTILEQLSHEKAEQINKPVHGVSVRDTKSRWGSCSTDGRLSYSWRLIFAPFEAMDYVVAHEVAHLRHMNHSQAFWTLCEQLSDDYEEGKYWMRHHGSELMAFG